MKKKTKLFLTSALALAAITCVAAGCEETSSATSAPEGEAYEWTYDKPFAGTPDDYMKIDGVLDEDVWQDQRYIGQSFAKRSWSATTYFTDKGLYIGMKATDENMVYNTRFTNRSNFNIYLCKTGSQTYGINGLSYHESRCIVFQCDPYYCRSKNRVPYYYEAVVDGELNSETTCTLTAELFLTWEDLYYTEDELGEDGYPEDLQMYVNWSGEGTEVLGTCLWREETYLHFDKDGYKAAEDDGAIGSDDNALQSTDMWQVNDEGNWYTTAGRAQILWLNDSYAKNFVLEADLRPLNTNPDGSAIKMRGDTVYGRFGFVNENASGNYSVFSVYARTAPATLSMLSCRQIDSFHWSNKIGVSGSVKSGITDDYVTLRIIKQDDMFYYFYGNTYWKSERITDLQEECYSGIFTSQGVEILDYSFADYSDDEEGLLEELSKYVYFVEVPGQSAYGLVTTTSYAVTHDHETTLSFVPQNGGILTGITLNGEDVYDAFVEKMDNSGNVTIKVTEDTNIEATFSAFPTTADGKKLRTVVIDYKDADGKQLKNATYEIRGNNKLLYYTGEPQGSGKVIISLPEKGTYEVDGKTFEISGNYSLYTTFSDYHDFDGEFTLDENTTYTNYEGKKQGYMYTAVVTENDWGTIKVNGKTLTGSGTLKYNEETGNYYVDGGVHRWYKTMVGDDEFELDITINAYNIGHKNNDLAGIQFTNGSRIIVLKAHLENSGSLFVATGSDAESTNKEVCITGFGWANAKNPTDKIKGSGSFTFKVVKSGSVIYIYNASGVQRIMLSANGLTCLNGASIVGWSSGSTAGVNADIKTFFASTSAIAVGVRTYASTSISAEWAFDYKTTLSDKTKTEISYGAFKLTTGEGVTTSDAYTVKTGYAKGEQVKLALASSSASKKVRLIVENADGVQILDGLYDSSSRSYVFSFVHCGGAFTAKAYAYDENDMNWQGGWNEWTPDRDNTTV